MTYCGCKIPICFTNAHCGLGTGLMKFMFHIICVLMSLPGFTLFQ